jgi:hypothetical protein
MTNDTAFHNHIIDSVLSTLRVKDVSDRDETHHLSPVVFHLNIHSYLG